MASREQVRSNSNPSGNYGVKSPVRENNFNITRDRNDRDDDHSPRHNEEDYDDEIEEVDDDEIEDELIVVSEDKNSQKGSTPVIDKTTPTKKTHRYEETALEESEDYQDEFEDGFDESYMYNELAKMEKLEKLSVINSSEQDNNGEKKEEELDLLGRPMRLYGTPRNQPVYAVGKTQISHSQAKLFNLFDKNGGIGANSIKNKSKDSSEKNYDSSSYKRTFSRVKTLAAPREVDTSMTVVEDDKELTFQPVKSKQAEAAMRNKSCGYDFVDRLKANGDFMERNGNSDKNQKTKNLNLESLKDDYKALLDKLACPNCKSEQSFDEYYEKIRDCRRCNEKFTKSKISKSSTFERKNKENEEKRLLKLKAVDDAIYGTLGQLPPKIGYPGKLKQKINAKISDEDVEKSFEKYAAEEKEKLDSARLNKEKKVEITEVKVSSNKNCESSEEINKINVEIEKKCKADSNITKKIIPENIRNTSAKKNKIGKKEKNSEEENNYNESSSPRKTSKKKNENKSDEIGGENSKKKTISMTEKFQRLVS